MIWERLDRWHKAAIVAGAILASGWGAHATVQPILDQVAANTRWIQMSQFEQLSQTLCHRQLRRDEYHRWCYLGRVLGYWTQCPPNRRGVTCG